MRTQVASRVSFACRFQLDRLAFLCVHACAFVRVSRVFGTRTHESFTRMPMNEMYYCAYATPRTNDRIFAIA